jgi:CHAD domain-containing protein
MANRRSALIARAVHDGDARKVAVGAAVAGGAVAAARLGWDRLRGDDPRKFRLRDEEPVPDGLRRIAVGQLDPAIEGLAGEGPADAATSVHEARKSLKRLRALVRLARHELGEHVYRRENTAFRDAGRRLSGARDTRVLLDTLDSVSKRHPKRAPRQGLLPFRRTLMSRHANESRRVRNDDAAGEVLRELRQVRDRVPRWPLEHESIESLAPGFERIYGRGRKAYRRADKDPSTENLHELRKRAKDLWYAGQIVRPASPKRLKAMSKGAKELSDLIGEDHDLALLAASADARPDRFGDEASLEELLGVIRKRRKRLRRRSMKLGAELFRRKPGAVARLIEEPAAGS